tara:strand:+ start:77 stop:361 length:285 start_codon:yes stop_codon:yes gene_type:complete
MKKNFIHSLDDDRLRTFVAEGRLRLILKRGVLIYGGGLFLAILLSFELNGDDSVNKNILVSLAISVIAGTIYGSYLWHAINAEYTRRKGDAAEE